MASGFIWLTLGCSLYKQGTKVQSVIFCDLTCVLATVGNVTTPRPSIFDMLGRAKYDAWAKQKDLDPKEAKWRYVETLMKASQFHNMLSSS